MCVRNVYRHSPADTPQNCWCRIILSIFKKTCHFSWRFCSKTKLYCVYIHFFFSSFFSLEYSFSLSFSLLVPLRKHAKLNKRNMLANVITYTVNNIFIHLFVQNLHNKWIRWLEGDDKIYDTIATLILIWKKERQMRNVMIFNWMTSFNVVIHGNQLSHYIHTPFLYESFFENMKIFSF